MTEQGDDGDDKVRWSFKWEGVVGHYYYPVAIAIFMVFLIWEPIAWLFGWGDGVETASAIVLMMVFIGMLQARIFVHDRNLCERCIQMMPLDGSAYAERWARHLAFHHMTQGWKQLFGFLMLFIVAGLTLPHLIGVTMYGLITNSLMVWWLLSEWRHQRVQPWCRRCRRDDGGGGRIREPSPDPAARA